MAQQIAITAVGSEQVATEVTSTRLNFFFTSGLRNPLQKLNDDRRFVAMSFPSMPPAEIKRIVDDVVGTFQLFDQRGRYIGQTAPPPLPQALTKNAMRTAAACMAYANELASAARLADLDYEATGTVSVATISGIRQLLGDIGAA